MKNKKCCRDCRYYDEMTCYCRKLKYLFNWYNQCYRFRKR